MFSSRPTFQYQAWFLSCWVVLKSNYGAVGYLQDVTATIITWGFSCLASCGSWMVQLGKTTVCLLAWEACMVLSSLMKGSPQGRGFHVRPLLGPPGFMYKIKVVSSVTGTYLQLLEGNEGQYNISCCLFWDKASICSPSPPETPSVTQAGLELWAILLHLPPENLDYKCESPCPVSFYLFFITKDKRNENNFPVIQGFFCSSCLVPWPEIEMYFNS